jgi:hypothetical protein
MLVFRVFAKGFRDVRGRFAKASDEKVKEFCTKQFEMLAKELVSAMKEEVPVDTGRLRASVKSKVEADRLYGKQGTILRVYAGAPYAKFVLFGTRPHVAPIDALRGWAERHGIPVGAVWWSIKTKGTSVWAGRKYGGPSIGPIPNLFHARAFAKVGLGRIDETARKISTGLVSYLTR